MIWNTLRAKKEVLGFTHRELSEFVGVEFMQDWRKAFIRKGLVLKDIYSDEYLKSLEESKYRISYPEKIFISKYMPKKLIDISLQSDIYNDVMSYYNWHEGDIFGVEIYNQKVASLNKQIFMFLWDRAEKAPI